MEGVSKKRLEGLWHGYDTPEECNLLLKLINECKELNPWHPIETAPKDRKINLFYPDVGQQIGFWNLTFKDYGGAYLSQCNPTHWQELPEDPK